MSASNTVMSPGTFQVGCNYWASHAGMMMWRNWQPEVVRDDLKQLAAEGLQVLRVFPLWPDFQPLTQIYSGLGTRKELRIGEKALGTDAAGRAGVSLEAMERFRFMADVAAEEGLRLVVGLLTGWMSGRLFVPLAFEALNVLTDPRVRRWQVRFVRYFVEHFREHPAIYAWDLGNECNCMGRVENADQAWDWTALIAGAIHQSDPEKPVVSGMHSLSAGEKGHWRIQDQGELTDILTTHPYPIFTPYCNQDPVHYLRNGFHATAECRLYADLSGRPCFAEEMGTLGPMVASEKVAASYMQSALFTLWSQDCRAMLWWCAYDQDHLDFAPYERGSCERELGLIRKDREVKPVLKTVGAFQKKIEGLPIAALPPCRREAVCILTEGQDQWAAAYSSFILAKQAGFDITFQHADDELLEADLYLLPSIESGGATSRRLRNQLLERVEAGAQLYVSFGGAFFQPFSEFFGLTVLHREKSMTGSQITFAGSPDSPVLVGNNEFRLVTETCGAEVIATEADDNIAFARNPIGKGAVFYLSFPVEVMLSQTPGAFHGPEALPYYRLYQRLAEQIIAKRALRVDHPTVTVTEHPLSSNEAVAVVINHAPDDCVIAADLSEGWQIGDVWIGDVQQNDKLAVGGNDGVVLLLRQL